MIFRSTVEQHEGVIIADQLFHDMQKFIDEQKDRWGVEKLGRGHPLQHIMNSTSGNYISPTAMKSHESCPGGYLMNKLFTEKTGGATSIGRSYHTIMERFYQGSVRTRLQLDALTETVLMEDNQEGKAAEWLKAYSDGFWEAGDYLGGDMNHQSLECTTEQFIKPICKPLGVDLGVPIYLLVDRVDIRDSGIYVIDYKTGGFGDPNPYIVSTYLPQMIMYKWGVEAEYGNDVSKVFLFLPGASKEHKWTDMNVNSLVEQSKVVESVFTHVEHARKCREVKRWETSLMRYCNSCSIRDSCYTWLTQKSGQDPSKAPKVINVEVEVEDKTYLDE